MYISSSFLAKKRVCVWKRMFKLKFFYIISDNLEMYFILLFIIWIKKLLVYT